MTKKFSDVFNSIKYAKMQAKHDKGHSGGSTDDEEHGAVSSTEFGQQVKHAKKRSMTVNESRGHKVLATFFKNREVAQRAFTGQNKSPEEKAEHEKKHREAMTKAHNEYVKKNPNSIFKPMKEEVEFTQEQIEEAIHHIITARQIIGNAKNTPGDSHEYMKFLKSLRDKFGKEYSTNVHRTANKLATTANKLATEEAEQLDEISKKTLGSYVKGAAKDIADRQERIRAGSKPYPGESQADYQKDMSKALALQSKRNLGMTKAINRLTKEDQEEDDRQSAEHHQKELEQQEKEAKKKEKVKEEVEQIDELSKGLVARYANKVAKTTQANYDKSKDKFQFSSGREDGMKNAVKRLTKEESEQIDEISKSTLASYIKKSKDQAGLIAHDLGHRVGSSPEAGTTLKPSYITDKGKYVQRSKGINRAAEKLAKETTEYKGIGTDVVDKKKVLNPPIPLTQKAKQVKDFKEGDDPCWKNYQMVGTKKKNGNESRAADIVREAYAKGKKNKKDESIDKDAPGKVEKFEADPQLTDTIQKQ